MSSDATGPKTKVTEKKLKTAIPDVYFKPEEMRAIDRKDQVTVIRRLCTENRALVTVVMTNLDKVPEEVTSLLIMLYQH